MSFNFKVSYGLEHVEVSANEEFYNIYTYKVQYLIIYMKQSDTLLYQFLFSNFRKWNVHVHINNRQL